MRPWIAAAALVAGFAAGFAVAPRGGGSDGSVSREELERAERRADEATVRAQRAERALEAAGRGVAAPDGPGRTPGGVAPPQETGDGEGVPEETRSRARLLRDLSDRVRERFESHDGDGLLEALRRLAEIVPEGREAAMDLAVRIQRDFQGERSLGIDEVTFYATLGDSGVRDLLVWALAHPSPAEFRVLAVYSIPWVLPKEAAIGTLTEALLAERDVGVQQSLVASLGRMSDSRVDAALGAIFGDTSRDPSVRMRIPFALATSDDPAVVARIEEAAAKDPDPGVRAAARSALQLARPPADGYALTVVHADGSGAAAGLRPGDIVVAYDGRAVATTEAFLAAIDASASPAAGAPETVVLTLVRDGAEIQLPARRGRLGVQGRAVRKS